MQKENSSEINLTDQGSLVWSEFPKSIASIYTKSPHLISTFTTNSTSSRYGKTISSPYEKEPMPVSPGSSYFTSDHPPDVTWNNDYSFTSQLHHFNRLSNEADKIQQCYPRVEGITSPKDHFGHIKINRYDFVTEEPRAKKGRSTKGPCPVHGARGKRTNDDEHEVNVEGVEDMNSLEGRKESLATGNNASAVHFEGLQLPCKQKQDSQHISHENQTVDIQRVSKPIALNGTDSHLQSKPQFPWLGNFQNDRLFNDTSLSEAQVSERPMDFMNGRYPKPLLPMTNKPVLPSIGSFASPLQYMSDLGYYGIPNPFLPPVMYPGNFDRSGFSPFLGLQPQFYPFGSNDPFYWMTERNKDLVASVYPTVIRPKHMTGAPPFADFTGHDLESQPDMPRHVSYPNPAAMFRAANLIPHFFLKKENATSFQQGYAPEAVNHNSQSVNSKQDIGSSSQGDIKTQNAWNIGQSTSHNYESFFHSHMPKAASQPPWIRADNAVSYTLAAAPSDVMTYLPKTSRTNYDGLKTGDTCDDYDAGYLQGDGDDGTFYSYQESFNEVNHDESKDVKKPVPPSRKSHVCDVCGKTYARAFTLKTHQRVHTGEKPYKCKVCQRTFAQGSGLEAHMRIHTGEKPYECQVCYRAFSHSSAVKSHLRTHTGEKPFRCNRCGKHFGDNSTLKKHIRIHTGEKPFKCHICDFKFTQVGNMKKHLKNIHGDKSL